MKQIFLSRKGIEVKEVPEPLVDKGKILIKNQYSCVSPGTEISSLNSIKKSTVRKIIEKPEIIKSVIDVLKKRGLRIPVELSQENLENFTNSVIQVLV